MIRLKEHRSNFVIPKRPTYVGIVDTQLTHILSEAAGFTVQADLGPACVSGRGRCCSHAVGKY